MGRFFHTSRPEISYKEVHILPNIHEFSPVAEDSNALGAIIIGVSTIFQRHH